MTAKIKVYGHPSCLMVRPIRMILDGSDIPYEYFNIHRDEDARNFVRTVNHGNESVPTIVFPDESTMTEPSNEVFLQKLDQLGYAINNAVQLRANILSWLVMIFSLSPILVIIYVVLDIVGII